MSAVLGVLAEADPALSFQQVTVGLKAYEFGATAGFDVVETENVYAF